MQKYKAVASKSQKKYTVIVSADSPQWAKEKLHSDGYSILSIEEVNHSNFSGSKFLFQVQKDGKIKNGVIVWEDIFKVYIKLVDELKYDVISLYPEWDEAHNNAEKKQKIIWELKEWYILQNKKKVIEKNEKSNETFYLKKKLQETSKLIEKVAGKFENILANASYYEIDEIRLGKLQKIYEKLTQIKNSTNLAKLQSVGELALVKIAEIEVQSLEQKKDVRAKKLLLETNNYLKKIWSDRHFVEENKDWRKKINSLFSTLQETFSKQKASEPKKISKKDDIIDTDSYNFLKTVLLLQKYKEKKKDNNKQIKKNIKLFLSPFSSHEEKDKILLKRKVITQNISLLTAKKNWNIHSYTGIKKWIWKIKSILWAISVYISKNIFYLLVFYTFFLFSIGMNFWAWDTWSVALSSSFISVLLVMLFFYYFFECSKNIALTTLNIVFWIFLYIFTSINF